MKSTGSKNNNRSQERAGAILTVLRSCLLAGILLTVWVSPGLSQTEADSAVSIRAHVDRTRVVPGEALQFNITIEGGEGTVDLQELPDFTVFPQGTSTSVRIINGSAARRETHTYLLIAQRSGQLLIPALTVQVQGQALQTDPIAIAVTPQPDAAGTEHKEVWVENAVSDPQPFVGQPITYTFTLYQTVRVTNAAFQPPAFDGFSVEEIQERDSERTVVNGRECVMTRIHYILIPSQTGDLTIAPAALQLGIVRADVQRRRTPFDDFFDDPLLNRNRVETKVLQTAPLTVQVKPLPPYAGSTPFSGLVGRFTMNAAVQDTALNVGDSTTLTVTVQGQGNIMDARAPALHLPDSIKTYADAPTEEIRRTAEGYSGKKMYRTALVPLQAGTTELPEVRLAYFDVAQADYRILTAPLPALQVQPGAGEQGTAPAVGADARTTRQQSVAFTGRDILPLKEGVEALQSHQPMAWPFFLLWIAAPAAAFGILMTVQHLFRRDDSTGARMRSKIRQTLTAAQATEAREPFLSALYQALVTAIHAHAGREGGALTWKEAQALLCGAGTDAATAAEAADLLTAIESIKFSGAPLTPDIHRDLLDRTRRMARRLAA
ncbi:MAG: hypothetical protein VR64_17655 [Desulfatitalea sp. BRH_c12]|nr:MAG: hypothetical protein VR64_17655 [Desulfatitalea sp. BRH_c12]